MNQRERKKKERIAVLQKIIEKNPEKTTEELVSFLIVKHGISRKVALEEVRAIKKYMENGK